MTTASLYPCPMLHEFVEKSVFPESRKSAQVPAGKGIKKIVRQGCFRVSKRCTNFAIPTSNQEIVRITPSSRVGNSLRMSPTSESHRNRGKSDTWKVPGDPCPVTRVISRRGHRCRVGSQPTRSFRIFNRRGRRARGGLDDPARQRDHPQINADRRRSGQRPSDAIAVGWAVPTALVTRGALRLAHNASTLLRSHAASRR